MATSSLSRDFIVNDPKSIDKLIEAMDNPVKIELPKTNEKQEKESENKALCAIKKYLASLE